MAGKKVVKDCVILAMLEHLVQSIDEDVAFDYFVREPDDEEFRDPTELIKLAKFYLKEMGLSVQE